MKAKKIKKRYIAMRNSPSAFSIIELALLNDIVKTFPHMGLVEQAAFKRLYKTYKAYLKVEPNDSIFPDDSIEHSGGWPGVDV